MSFFKKLAFCLVFLTFIFVCSGCGKVSAPEPIQGSGYPHTYPRH